MSLARAQSSSTPVPRAPLELFSFEPVPASLMVSSTLVPVGELTQLHLHVQNQLVVHVSYTMDASRDVLPLLHVAQLQSLGPESATRAPPESTPSSPFSDSGKAPLIATQISPTTYTPPDTPTEPLLHLDPSSTLKISKAPST